MLLPGIGEAGQHALGEASALLVGCGALGTVIADAMVRAGIGRLTIVDRDVVEITNLQRQVLFDEADAHEGRPKAEAAAARLRRINGAVEIIGVVADCTARNIETFLNSDRRVGVVLDGTDNFQTRYLLNDACVKFGVPLIYGGAVGTVGMQMTLRPRGRAEEPCLRCIFPDPPPPGAAATCDTAGVLGPAAGIVANMQASEAVKLLSGNAERCSPSLRQFDLWSNLWRTINAGPSRADCTCCALRNFEFLEDSAGDGTAMLCGANAVQVTPRMSAAAAVDLDAMAERLAAHGLFRRSGPLVRGRLDGRAGAGIELTVFHDGRAIVKGTQDPARARAIYARYVGV